MVKKHFTPDQKHLILTQYSPQQHGHGFASLASRFGVAGGAKLISNWYHRWNGTAASLLEKKKIGRPRILKKSEVTRYIKQPVVRKNRSHTAVHYTDLVQRVHQNSGRQPSLRTIQRYGREDAAIRDRSTTITTTNECQS